MQDESRLYCTELLYAIVKRIVQEIELDIVYIRESERTIIPLEAISNSGYFSEVYFIVCKGFNTQELASRGSFRALKKILNPEQIPCQNNIPRPFRAKLDPQFSIKMLYPP
jgi:hypothetical protein